MPNQLSEALFEYEKALSSRNQYTLDTAVRPNIQCITVELMNDNEAKSFYFKQTYLMAALQNTRHEAIESERKSN
jgi:phage portal protein BeeE